MFRRKSAGPPSDAELWYREVQRFRDTWLWPALLTPAVLASLFVIYVGIEVAILDDDGIAARDAVALAICFYVLKGFGVLIVALYAARLELEVRADGLYWRIAPFQFKHRHVTVEELGTAQIRSGKREWRRGWRVYAVKGRSAVEIEIPNGRRLLIGTQQPVELAAALTRKPVPRSVPVSPPGSPASSPA